MTDAATLRRVARLICFGLKPSESPASDSSYRALIAEYQMNPEFQVAVDAIAGGLELEVPTVTPLGIIVLPESSASPFAYAMPSHRARGHAGSSTARLLEGLAITAIATCCYPRAESFDDPDDVLSPRITASDVDAFLRDCCEEMQREARRTGDTVVGAGTGLEAAWEAYLSRPQARVTNDGRRSPTTTISTIARMMELLRDQRCLQRNGTKDGEDAYSGTIRFRAAVAQTAGHAAYEALATIRRRASGVST